MSTFTIDTQRDEFGNIIGDLNLIPDNKVLIKETTQIVQEEYLTLQTINRNINIINSKILELTAQLEALILKKTDIQNLITMSRQV